jgi:hypothetical protein
MYRIKPIVGPGGCAASVSGLNGADEVSWSCNANGDSRIPGKNDGVDGGSCPMKWDPGDASGITASGLWRQCGDSTGEFGLSSGDGKPMTDPMWNGV